MSSLLIWKKSRDGRFFKNIKITEEQNLQNFDLHSPVKHSHDNYIHHTGGEGVYVGYTGWYKVSSNKTCNPDEEVFGNLLENVNIHHNNFDSTGWDAIQVNLVERIVSSIIIKL